MGAQDAQVVALHALATVIIGVGEHAEMAVVLHALPTATIGVKEQEVHNKYLIGGLHNALY